MEAKAEGGSSRGKVEENREDMVLQGKKCGNNRGKVEATRERARRLKQQGQEGESNKGKKMKATRARR